MCRTLGRTLPIHLAFCRLPTNHDIRDAYLSAGMLKASAGRSTVGTESSGVVGSQCAPCMIMSWMTLAITMKGTVLNDTKARIHEK